jgi:hypothetical protein
VGDIGGGLAGSAFIFFPEASSSEPGGFFLLLELLESERGGTNEDGVGDEVPLLFELLLLLHLFVPLLRSLL